MYDLQLLFIYFLNGGISSLSNRRKVQQSYLTQKISSRWLFSISVESFDKKLSRYPSERG